MQAVVAAAAAEAKKTLFRFSCARRYENQTSHDDRKWRKINVSTGQKTITVSTANCKYFACLNIRANRLNSNNTTILKSNNKKLLFKFICSASVKFNARMVSSSVYKRFWVFIRNVLSHDAMRCVILFHSLTKSGICSHWLFLSLFHVFDFIRFVIGFWKWKNEQKKNENINRNIVTCKC